MNERFLFAGTPAFAATILEALLKAKFPVVGVLTQADKPTGRGQRYNASPVKKLALAHELPLLQPNNLKDPEVFQNIASFQPTQIIVAAYGLLVPPNLLALPPKGCLNVHASLLPRFRGAAPLQYAILSGDTQTGITLMQMEAGLDTGPMLAKATYTLSSKETYGSLERMMAALGAALLVRYLKDPHPSLAQPQPLQEVCYAPKITKKDTTIHWSQPAIQIERQVRAFYPQPGAHTSILGTSFKVLKSVCDKEPVTRTPGTIVHISKKALIIATAKGHLHIETIQLPSKKPTPVAEYVRTNSLPFFLTENLLLETP